MIVRVIVTGVIVACVTVVVIHHNVVVQTRSFEMYLAIID